MSQEYQLSFSSEFLSHEMNDELLNELQPRDMAVINEVLNISDPDQEDIMDSKDAVHDGYNMFNKSIALTTQLSNEEYCGPFDFDVTIDQNTGQKNSWVYSHVLNKIYMDMHIPFPVGFRIKHRPDISLFIRISAQYSHAGNLKDTVQRCINHEHANEKSNFNVPEHIWQHILRCSSNSHVNYVGTKGTEQRLSIVIPFSLPQAGSDTVREIFEFVCKSTCPAPGVNRRLLEVVFTLEDINLEILGRKCINVRVCACPKRDKEKDETEYMSRGEPKGKKRRKTEKLERGPSSSAVNDVTDYSLGHLRVIGKDNYHQVIKIIEALMSKEVLRHENGNKAPYVQCLQEVTNIMYKEGIQ